VSQLEALREDGAEYLVFPATAQWWLLHYGELAEHLEGLDRTDGDVCTIFRLDGGVAEIESGAEAVADER
jgi:hypothetical protein